jgi:tape measure domain-containing protein
VRWSAKKLAAAARVLAGRRRNDQGDPRSDGGSAGAFFIEPEAGWSQDDDDECELPPTGPSTQNPDPDLGAGDEREHDPNVYELWADNAESFARYAEVATQWQKDNNGIDCGLNYAAVLAHLAFTIPDKKHRQTAYEDLRIMERAAIPIHYEMAKKINGRRPTQSQKVGSGSVSSPRGRGLGRGTHRNAANSKKRHKRKPAMSDMLLRLVISGDGSAAVSVVKQTAGAVEQLDSAQKRLAGSGKTVTDSAADYAAELRKQLRLLTENTAQLREVEAISRGATQSQLQDIRALGAQIDGIKGKQDAVNNLVANAQNLFARLAIPITVATTLASWAKYIGDANDQVRVTIARINNVTDSLTESRAVYAGLVGDAIKLRVGLDDTLSGYTRIALAVKELGGTAKQAREINEILIATAKASGASRQEAAAAARQFAQALGSGVLQGDELRSILENNQELARQLAKGLNVSVGSLRTLGEQGKLTADVVARALLGQLTEVRKKIADVPLTTADATTKLGTAFEAWLIAGEKVEMKAGLIARAINAMADGFQRAATLANTAPELNVTGVTETPGGAAMVAPNGRRNNAQMAAAVDAQREELKAAFKRLEVETASEIVAGTLGLTNALKESGDAMTKVMLGNANAVEKVGIASAEMIGAMNKREALLIQQRAAFVGTGQDTEVIDRQLGQLRYFRDQYVETIAPAIAAANQQLWDTFEKQSRVGVDKQVATLDRAVKEGVKINDVLLAAVQNQRTALEAQLAFGTIAQTEYLQQRTELAAREASIQAASLGSERANATEQIALYAKVVAAIKAKFGDEAAASSDAQKQIEAAQLKLIDVSKQRVEQTGKQAKETVDATKVEIGYADANRKLAEAFGQSYATMVDAYAAAGRARADALEQEQFELSLLSLTDQARNRAIALRKIDLQTRKELLAVEVAFNAATKAAINESDYGQLLDQRAKERAAILANAEAQKLVTATIIDQSTALSEQKQFWDGFFQSIKGGWKGVRDYIKNFFFDWLLKQLSQQFVMNVAVSGSGGVGGIAGAVGNLLGGGGGVGGSLLSGAGSLVGGALNGVGSLFGLGSATGLMGLGSGAGLMGTLGAGANLALTGLGGAGLSGLASGIGMAFSSSLMAGLGSLIPVVGPLIAIIGLASQFFKNKDGLWFDFGQGHVGQGAGASQEFQTALAPVMIRGEGKLSDVAPFVAQFQNLAKNFVDIFGEELAAQARVKLGDWTGFSNRGRGTEYENAAELQKALQIESKDVMAEYFSRVFSVVNQKIADTISAWSGTTEELVKYIQEVLAVSGSLRNQAPMLKAIIGEAIDLDQLIALQKEGETLSATLGRVLSTFSATSEIAEIMGKGADAFGAVGLASLESRERLVSLAGGLQALSGGITFYLEKFFTDEERQALARKRAQAAVDEGFKSLGLAVPTSREAFRKLVDGIDLTTQAGQALLVSLLKLAPALDVVLTATEKAGPSEAYQAKFWSEAERAAYARDQAQKLVDAVFAQFGVAVPENNAAFRALVESIDTSTDAGKKFYNALMGVAGAFDTARASTQQTRDGQWDRVMANDPTRSSTQGSVSAATPYRFTDLYEANFYSPAEQAARRLAESGRMVTSTFALLDRAVPQTEAEFRAVVDSFDTSTEAGRRAVDMLMAAAPAWIAVRNAAKPPDRTAPEPFVNDPTRVMGQGAPVDNKPRSGPTEAYLNLVYTASERAARSLAESGRLINETFARYDIAVPTSMAGLRQLVDGIDRTTESGEAFYQVIMSLIPAFAEVEAAKKPMGPTDSYLANYFTESQQAAYKMAQAQRSVNSAFADMGVAVPKTRAEFVALVNAQDQTTAQGRAMVAMLMLVEPAFTTITAAAEGVAAAAAASGSGGVRFVAGDLLNIGDDWAKKSINGLFAIIDSTAESQLVKLQRKLAASGQLVTQWQGLVAAGIEAHGGELDAADQARQFALNNVRAMQAQVAADLALLVTLQAQYGDKAEAMFELEKWRTEQLDVARNNSTQLLLVEQSYQARRNAILTGGVASGLSALSTQLRAWLDKLLLNDSLTTLTPAQRLAESQRQYSAAMAGTDPGAITSAADAYLREARNFYASGDAYSAIFSAVVAAVTARANGGAATTIVGTATGGSSSNATGTSAVVAASATTASAAAATAVEAANASTAAIIQTRELLAEIMAQTKNAVVNEAQTTRAADVTNTNRVVSALGDRSTTRVI